MKKIYYVLHCFTKFNTFLFCFSILFFIQKYTIGFILNIFLKQEICYLIYIIFSLIFTIKKINISSPYEKYLK